MFLSLLLDNDTLAIQLLRRGQNYNEAIRLLKASVATHKTEALPHAQLACALLGRAAALSLAKQQQKYEIGDRETYAFMSREWDAEKNNPTSIWYKKPAPKPPRLCTWDDGKPYTLAPSDAEKQIIMLCTDALTHSQASIQLAQTDTERGEMLYLHSWAQMVVFNLQTTLKQIPPLKIDWKQILASSQEAAQRCPENQEIRRFEIDVLARHESFNYATFQLSKEKKQAFFAFLASLTKPTINDLYRMYWVHKNFLRDFPEQATTLYPQYLLTLQKIRVQNSNNYPSLFLKLQWLYEQKSGFYNNPQHPLKAQIETEIARTHHEYVAKTDAPPTLTSLVEAPSIYQSMVHFVGSINYVPLWSGFGYAIMSETNGVSFDQQKRLLLDWIEISNFATPLSLTSPGAFSISPPSSVDEKTRALFREEQDQACKCAYQTWENRVKYTYFTARPW
jgi:hypothetical protein